MSKKKNTLKDLDEFLKQQAASLVSPQKLNVASAEEAKPQPKQVEKPALQSQAEITIEKIVGDLRELSDQKGEHFRNELYDLIVKTLDTDHISPEDKVLINTALYLKHGSRWKEVIRDFWKNR